MSGYIHTQGKYITDPKPKELLGSFLLSYAFVKWWNCFIFSNGKTDRRRNKCHLLSQKTLFLFSFNLNFLSWPDAFEESFQVRNTKFLTAPHSNVRLIKNAVQRIYSNFGWPLYSNICILVQSIVWYISNKCLVILCAVLVLLDSLCAGQGESVTNTCALCCVERWNTIYPYNFVQGIRVSETHELCCVEQWNTISIPLTMTKNDKHAFKL